MSRFVLSALLTLGLAGPAWAGDPNNLTVFNDVSKTVQRYSFFTIFDSVHASVADGVVTLSGKVTMPYKASDIEKRVAKVDGVTQVVNKLEVLPVSSSTISCAPGSRGQSTRTRRCRTMASGRTPRSTSSSSADMSRWTAS